MSKRDELNALADRCEREEASRAFDVEIEDALGRIERWTKAGGWGESSGSSSGVTYRGVPYTMTATWWVPKARHRDPRNIKDVIATLTGRDSLLPRYTTSLDAAVGLVPEGARWSLSQGDRFVVSVHDRTALFHGDRYEAVGSSHLAALALCAAALRARAALADGAPTDPTKVRTPKENNNDAG